MGKSGGKVEVTKYFMSQHFGICSGPVDAITRIIIKEKEAWSGDVSAQSSWVIDKGELFGGKRKEGGAEGVVYYLPGADDQVLADVLAQKLGRSGGTDCPGYRGIASIFFVGDRGTVHSSYDFESKADGKKGFYWSANLPYLPEVWITVRRASIGLEPSYALIPCETGITGRWWRLFVEENNGDPTFTIVAEIEMRSVVGGPNIIAFNLYSAISGGAGSDIGGGDPPNAFDGHVLQSWVRNAPGGCWVGWKFDTQVAVREVSVQMTTSGTFAVGRPPKTGTIDYSNDDGETWTTAFAYADQTGWSAGETRLFSGESEEGEGALNELNANPAHIIFECLTNTDWGMGSPEAAINTASFEAAAVTLYAEAFGLSMIWTRQSSIQDFIQEVLDHIQAVLYVDPATGLLTLTLIRGDYDVETLPEINPSNAKLSNFGRKLWGDIANEIVVTWTNPASEQDETVSVQDLASIAAQGGIISDGRNYYGVRCVALASRLAARDLSSAGAPLATCEAEIDRTLWLVRPASVFAVVWPEYGLDGVVMRVVGVDYGRPGDMAIKVSLLEDVYGLDYGDYVEPPRSVWEDTSTAPEPLLIERVFTLPYYVANQVAVGAGVTPAYPDVVAGVLGTTADQDAMSYELWSEVTLSTGDLEWQSLADENIMGHGLLADALVAEVSTSGVEIDDLIGLTAPVVGGFALIGDEDEEGNELALITATGATLTLNRGVLDTVPRAWPAATPVWFIDEEALFVDPSTRAAAEAVGYKFLTRTSMGMLALADAGLVTHTLNDRPWLPSRPAAVEVYGEDFNTLALAVNAVGRPDPWVTVTWANRNRLLEDSQVLAWDDPDVMPETDQTTKIDVLAADGTTVLATHDGLTGTTFDVPDASFGGEIVVFIRVSSERTDADGTFISLQSHGVWVQVALGDLVTEEGDGMITEDGDTLRLEG